MLEYPLRLWEKMRKHAISHTHTAEKATFTQFLRSSVRIYIFKRPKNQPLSYVFYTQSHFNIENLHKNRILDPYFYENSVNDNQCGQIIVSPSEKLRNINKFILPVSLIQLLLVTLFAPFICMKILIEVHKSNIVPLGQIIKSSVKIYFLKILSFFWKQELLNHNNLIILLPIFYNFYALSINHASKQTGHTTIALQHGHNSEKHPAFQTLEEVTPNKALQWLPTQYLAWDNSSLQALPKGFDEAIEIGIFGYLAYWQASSGNENINQVIITGQPSIAIDNPLMIWAIRYCLDKGKHVLFRPHPRQEITYRIFHNLLRDTDITKFSIDSAGTFIGALKNAEVHVTGFSSAVIEASSLGVVSIGFDDRARQLVSSLCDGSMLIVATDKTSLREHLNRVLL